MKTAGSGGPTDGELGLEGLPLAPVPVAADHDVDQSEGVLVGSTVEHLAGHQHQTGAGAQQRQAVGRRRLDDVEQTGGRQQKGQRGRLPAREHQTRQARQVGRTLDPPDRATQLSQHDHVLPHVPLQVEHTGRPPLPPPVGQVLAVLRRRQAAHGLA